MSTQQPGWYPDPLRHADRRWFDGTNWTASVLDTAGRQGVDQLAGSAAAPLEAGTSAGPPPPPSSTGAADWGGPGGGTWADAGWRAPARDLPAVAAPAAWTPQPAARAGATRTPNPVALGLAALALVGIVLSMFVLDWVSSGPFSAGFGDLVADGASADAFVDTLTIWHFQWLGYVVAAAATAAFAAFVGGGVGSRRLGHVITAAVAGIGALLATLAIVRAFRSPGLDPELGAWLLPASFVTILAAVVVNARTISDR